MLRVLLPLCLAGAAWGQPAIGQNGVANAASRIPGALAGGALARGALVEIRGVRFGAAPAAVRVEISTARGRLEVPALAIRGRHLSFVLPETAAEGAASLRVHVGGESSAPVAVRIVASNPGIFSRNGLGWGPGAVENLAPGGARQPNDLAHPARPGQRLAVRITGRGGARAVAYHLGGVRGVAAPGRVVAQGEEELILPVPAQAARGCFVPLWLEAAPGRASNVVTVAVADRGPCPAVIPPFTGERLGVAAVARTRGDPPRDEALVAFAAKTADPVFAPLLMLPPPGTCTAYTGSFQSGAIVPQSISSSLIADLGGDGLDAGPELEIRRGEDRRALPRVPGAPGLYRRKLGVFLPPGEFAIAGPGGGGVGAFRWTLQAAPRLEWTNAAAAAAVDRSRDLELRWKPGAGIAVSLAMNVDQESTASAMTFCVADAARGRLTIPRALLANLPASGDLPGIPYDQVFLASLRAAAQAGAAGLDRVVTVSLDAQAQTARFR